MSRFLRFTSLLILAVLTTNVAGTQPSDLPEEPLIDPAQRTDWLIDASPYRAAVYRGSAANEIQLSNGLLRRTFRLTPNGATVGLDDLVADRALLRSVQPEAVVTIDGRRLNVGGLQGQPNHAYLLPQWLDEMTRDPEAMQLVGFEVGTPKPRFDWKRVRASSPNSAWPPTGVYLRMDYQWPRSEPPTLQVSVHYELYDGLPALAKWITVTNPTRQPITVDRFTSELLAIVEQTNWVEARDGVEIPRPDCLHVETDFAFGGFNVENASRHVVHWQPDPQYATQVNYLQKTPCLLRVEPTYGPAQTVAAGATFTSCRSFELIHDSSERERRGLALRKMYRVIAPWVTENPLMHHMQIAAPARVREAIDQAAEVGFEMIILSFGSGFDIENESPDYVDNWKSVADYARSKQIEIGGYSLLSSRRIGDGNDVVSPPGITPTHGHCPALTSDWGRKYFRKLKQFFAATGFRLLEHDGSYPGDVDITPRPPYQTGLADSRWAQWSIIRDFYHDCRAQGIYLNVPDYYFLTGSNKCGMGYREVNWSLPRAMQVIHTRQNIYDGTWNKTPSMGWMFVPLSQYHGGGAAATIEPLNDHLDHYRLMLQSNLGLGVQACYRGPRLYDTPATRELVKNEVNWFKRYRTILESDVVHGRRADGRDLDWMLHVDPAGDIPAMLIVYNPLQIPVSKTLRVDLYYAGLTEQAEVREREQAAKSIPLNGRSIAAIPVSVPAESMNWYVIHARDRVEKRD